MRLIGDVDAKATVRDLPGMLNISLLQTMFELSSLYLYMCNLMEAN